MDAEIIRETITMEDMLERYGLEPNRAGFINCPLHKDVTPSLKIYPHPRGWHCFSCGAGGSVIDWVMQMERVNFSNAVEMIENWFSLDGPAFDPAILHERREERKQRQELERRWVQTYSVLHKPHIEWTTELEQACSEVADLDWRVDT